MEDDQTFEGYTVEQVKMLCEMWGLGNPPDVIAFFEREDIPEEVKNRVAESVKDFVPNLPEPYDSIVDLLADINWTLGYHIAKEIAQLDKARGHLGAPE
jgi:hypothetical protein